MTKQLELIRLQSIAAAEVAERLKSFAEFDATTEKGRVFMEAAATSLGLPAHEGRNAYERFNIPELKLWLNDWASKEAQKEVGEAVVEAEAEQKHHTAYLDESQQHHTELMQKLADYAKRSVPDGADDEFTKLIRSSDEQIAQAAQRSHDGLMTIMQLGHRLKLKHCFTGHLVSDETAEALVNLYEVKK